ncbi:MAG: 3-dehydroquinate dehydratase [Cenarchaeum symbiont of Oopsacas minuta]|nr:3-dehydroquinate dehydratase [Cenarchaeum symbiont of Oopsacas minuta]
MKYKMCASIAQKTPRTINSTLQKALTVCDYAELRLDFLKPNDVPIALELCKSKISKTICTLRPKSQGGVFTGTERERISIMKLIAEYNPYLLDVEYTVIKKNPNLYRYISDTKTNVLCSWHDFKRTPSIKELHSKMALMEKYSKYVKIVTMAVKPSDAATILALYSKRSKTNLVAFAMGDLGKISRLLCLYLGSPFTFVSLGRAIAPGQLSARQMLDTLIV